MLSHKTADIYTDLSGLSELKTHAKKDAQGSLKEVARQFESVFMNMMVKSMREASMGEGILDSQNSRFYRDMYDQQMAIELSGNPGMGLADLIVKQLGTKDKSQKDISSVMHETKLSRPPEPIELPKNPLKFYQQPPIKSPEQFIEQLRPLAEEAGKSLGVDPRLLLSQAALETGWGRAVNQDHQGQSSFNLFNIKADKRWQGNTTSVSSLEFEQGLASKQVSQFRAYGSYQESFQDYVKFIQQNPRYADALRQAEQPERYVKAIQEAGYATDPHYADKVMAIYHGKTMNQNLLAGAESANKLL